LAGAHELMSSGTKSKNLFSMILGTNLLFIHEDLINPINPRTYIFKIFNEINKKFTLIYNLNTFEKLGNKDELCMPCY
jgi:hypothetical protein